MGRMADIDEFMYSCGLEILHPGGIQKTDEMAEMCGVAKGKLVLDVGVGRGVTPCYLAEKYGCDIIGVDVSERMLQRAERMAEEKGLTDKVSLRKADAHNLPFEDGSVDVVIVECVTTLLDKPKAFSEMYRVLRSGGSLGDLEMTWQKKPSEEVEKRFHEIWEGYETMTLEEWKRFIEGVGFEDVKTVDFSDTLPDMEKALKKELGMYGMLKFGLRLALNRSMAKAMSEYRKMFKEYADYIGYGYFVARKPA